MLGFLILAVIVVVGFPVSITVCLWFFAKCIRALFSAEVRKSIREKPFFHFLWMLAAIACGIFATCCYLIFVSQYYRAG